MLGCFVVVVGGGGGGGGFVFVISCFLQQGCDAFHADNLQFQVMSKCVSN